MRLSVCGWCLTSTLRRVRADSRTSRQRSAATDALRCMSGRTVGLAGTPGLTPGRHTASELEGRRRGDEDPGVARNDAGACQWDGVHQVQSSFSSAASAMRQSCVVR